MIRAGKANEVVWGNGIWIFLDIGFSCKGKTCGLLIGRESPKRFTFNGAYKEICRHITQAKDPVNLVIEAPLSVVFDKKGNPTGRKFERHERKTRYWYCGLGCGVMVAAIYLIRNLERASRRKEVRLFEGFVSFKDGNDKSDHLQDVIRLRSLVKASKSRNRSIIPPDQFKYCNGDQLSSAFTVAGLRIGVPPVLQWRSK
jgi:hypothetical protein